MNKMLGVGVGVIGCVVGIALGVGIGYVAAIVVEFLILSIDNSPLKWAVRVLSDLSGINLFPIMGLAIHWTLTLICSGWLGWTGYLLGYGMCVKSIRKQDNASQ